MNLSQATNFRNWQNSNLKKMQQLGLSAFAFILTACGGGGGGSGSSTSSGSSQSDTGVSDNFNTALGSLTAPEANSLIVSKVGSKYLASPISGFENTSTSTASFTVVDDTSDNEYVIRLDAVGAGELTFNFEDPKDVVLLTNDSSISGFTRLKVVNGTLDATRIDLGSIDYIEVASGITVKYSQLEKISGIVANSNSAKITFEVDNQSELDGIQSLMSSGALKIYSNVNAITFQKSKGSGLDNASLTASKTAINALKTGLSQKPNFDSAVSDTILSSKNIGHLSINNDDKFVNSQEASKNIIVSLNLEDGYSIRSIKAGEKPLSNGSNPNEFILRASEHLDGEVSIVAEAVDLLGNTTVLTGSIVIDRIAPSSTTIFIEGESNGLNSSELASKPVISADLADGVSISSVRINTNYMSKVDGNYVLDGISLTDGSHQLEVEFVDNAGNKFIQKKTFQVDLDGASDAIIVVDGAEGGLNASEVSANTGLNVTVAENVTLSALKLDGLNINIDGGEPFTINTASLSDGAHTISAITTNEQGNASTTEQVFYIDTKAPNAPTVSFTGGDNVLSGSELTKNSLVFISTEADTTVVSSKLGNVLLHATSNSEIYSFDGSSMTGGRYDLVTTLKDSAGNTSVFTDKVTILGSSTGSDIFEIDTQTSESQINFDVYLVNRPAGLGDELPAYGLKFQLDTSKLDYVEGSVRGSEGALFAASETNSNSGTISIAGVYQSPFNDFGVPLFSFSATELASSQSHSIRLTDVTLEYVEMLDATYYVQT